MSFAYNVHETVRTLARFAFVQTILDCWSSHHYAATIRSALAYVKAVIKISQRPNVKWLHSPRHSPSRLDWAIQAFAKVDVRKRYMDLQHRANVEVSRRQDDSQTVNLHTKDAKGMMTFHWRPLEQCLPETFMKAHSAWEHYEDQIFEAVAMLNTVVMEEARYLDAVLSHPPDTDLRRLPGFVEGSLIRYKSRHYMDVPGYNSPQRDREDWLRVIEHLGRSGEHVAAVRTEKLELPAGEARKLRAYAQEQRARRPKEKNRRAQEKEQKNPAEMKRDRTKA